jgi:hypothetical protein
LFIVIPFEERNPSKQYEQADDAFLVCLYSLDRSGEEQQEAGSLPFASLDGWNDNQKSKGNNNLKSNNSGLKSKAAIGRVSTDSYLPVLAVSNGSSAQPACFLAHRSGW